jgi:hypothetical protein
MKISISQLKQKIEDEDTSDWIDPRNVIVEDVMLVCKNNYNYGRMLEIQDDDKDLEYLEENGDRPILAYFDMYLKNNGSISNTQLQLDRLWLIYKYWSVKAAYPIYGWSFGLRADELNSIITSIVNESNCHNPFVQDLIFTFARELILSLPESELINFKGTLTSLNNSFANFIINEYIQDAYKFSKITFEDMYSYSK